MFFRIQSLFLFLASALIGSLFFLPMVIFIGSDTTINYVEYYPSLILIIVSLVLSITILFSYKKRMFQVRVCTLDMIILLGLQIWLLVKYFTRDESMHFSFSIVFPIVAAILVYIAMKYIARDQAMVMSASRLRPSKKR